MGFSCLKSYGRCRWRAGVPGLTFVRVKRFTTDRVEVPPVTTAVRNVAAALLVVILFLGSTDEIRSRNGFAALREEVGVRQAGFFLVDR